MVNIILLGDNETPTSSESWGSYLYMRKFKAIKTGTVKEMHAWVKTGGSEQLAVVGIYSDDAGAPDELLATSSEMTVTELEITEHVVSISDVALVKDTYYWIAVSSTSSLGIGKKNNSGATGLYKSRTYNGALPDPAGTGYSGWANDEKVSAYGLEPSAGYPTQVIIV